MGSIPGLDQWVKDPAPLRNVVQAPLRSCIAVCLGHRLAASASIRPLAWEPPYAAGAAQEIAGKKKKKRFLLFRLQLVYSVLSIFYCTAK